MTNIELGKRHFPHNCDGCANMLTLVRLCGPFGLLQSHLDATLGPLFYCNLCVHFREMLNYPVGEHTTKYIRLKWQESCVTTDKRDLTLFRKGSRAAKIAPSDGSIPTTLHPLRAADTDQRPQLEPTSSKSSPLLLPTGISGMG